MPDRQDEHQETPPPSEPASTPPYNPDRELIGYVERDRKPDG